MTPTFPPVPALILAAVWLVALYPFAAWLVICRGAIWFVARGGGRPFKAPPVSSVPHTTKAPGQSYSVANLIHATSVSAGD